MITMTLMNIPTKSQHDFMAQTLEQEDAILLSASSIALAFKENSFQAQGLVRETDINMCGGTVHADWKIITNAQWCQLLLRATKNVTW